jgi:hypothetical protein
MAEVVARIIHLLTRYYAGSPFDTINVALGTKKNLLEDNNSLKSRNFLGNSERLGYIPIDSSILTTIKTTNYEASYCSLTGFF